MTSVTLARQAMGTRFELLLYGSDAARLRAAGEEALDEISRLDAQLSAFNPGSDVRRINSRAFHENIPIEPRLLALLQRAREYSQRSEGSFDLTVAPLMHCWGFRGGQFSFPSKDALADARRRVGSEHLLLTEDAVRFAREGMMLDFGALGKGHAVDCAVEILRELGITQAILHGGSSTVYGLGAPPGASGWKVAIDGPPKQNGETREFLKEITLRDEAMSVSAVWGRQIRAGEEVFGHVMDPRTGRPSRKALLSAVVAPSAADTDAYSTALLVEGPEGAARLAHKCGIEKWLLLAPTEEGKEAVLSEGLD